MKNAHLSTPSRSGERDLVVLPHAIAAAAAATWCICKYRTRNLQREACNCVAPLRGFYFLCLTFILNLGEHVLPSVNLDHNMSVVHFRQRLFNMAGVKLTSGLPQQINAFPGLLVSLQSAGVKTPVWRGAVCCRLVTKKTTTTRN